MFLKMLRKTDPSDRQPLIVITEYEGQVFTKRLSVGETLDVPDQLAYQIMAQYPGMFEQTQAAYKTKTVEAK